MLPSPGDLHRGRSFWWVFPLPPRLASQGAKEWQNLEEHPLRIPSLLSEQAVLSTGKGTTRSPQGPICLMDVSLSSLLTLTGAAVRANHFRSPLESSASEQGWDSPLLSGPLQDAGWTSWDLGSLVTLGPWQAATGEGNGLAPPPMTRMENSGSPRDLRLLPVSLLCLRTESARGTSWLSAQSPVSSLGHPASTPW